MDTRHQAPSVRERAPVCPFFPVETSLYDHMVQIRSGTTQTLPRASQTRRPPIVLSLQKLNDLVVLRGRPDRDTVFPCPERGVCPEPLKRGSETGVREGNRRDPDSQTSPMWSVVRVQYEGPVLFVLSFGGGPDVLSKGSEVVWVPLDERT